jgi:heavy metal sensor kinase
MVFPNRYVEITDTNGKRVAASRNLAGNVFLIPANVLNEANQRGASFTALNNLRVAVVPLSSGQDLGFAAVAEPLSVIEEGLRRLRRDFLAGVPLVLILASTGGYFLARKSLAPIELMNRQTQLITAERLTSRLDVTNARDELGRLATTINDLLTRLDASFSEQKRFIADASHELRTPLAVLRGETEVALGRTRTVDEYKESFILINDEAERLSRIVDDLFILARQPIDTPTAILKEQLSLNETVRNCSRAAQVLASRKGVELKTECDSSSIVFKGDEELLERMILNLLDNAVKYTPAGGSISIKLTRQNGQAQILVSDTGIGIPQNDQLHIFDRFYRVDKARSRCLGGAGLGLSIVRWIVEAHEGIIEIQSTLGKGSAFVVKLPLNS